MTQAGIFNPTYTDEDHETWHKLCLRQMDLIQSIACREFHEGFTKLALSINRLPHRSSMSDRLLGYTGWTLVDVQNQFLSATEWFEHIASCRFPVTDYIRKPDQLDFTTLPDLFHEYFGHLSFFTLPEFANIARHYGEVCLKARTEEQQLAIARLWAYTIEFGFIREHGELRVIGAGLLSSPGELLHALRPEVPKHPLDITRITQTPPARPYHNEYFILDSLSHWRAVIDVYAYQEGLA